MADPNSLNQNPWVAAGGAVNQSLMSSAFDMLKLFLMGYGAYALLKKAGGFVGGLFQAKQVPVEEVGEPEEEEIEEEVPAGSPQVIRVNPSRRRVRRVIRRRRKA